MAFKLTKAENSRRDELATNIEVAGVDLAAGIERFNEEVSKLFGIHIEAALVKYNEVLQEAQEFREDLVGRLEDEASDKSDRWHESEAGQAAEEFISEWRELDLDEVQINEPDPLEMPELEHHITLGEASDSRG